MEFALFVILDVQHVSAVQKIAFHAFTINIYTQEAVTHIVLASY